MVVINAFTVIIRATTSSFSSPTSPSLIAPSSHLLPSRLATFARLSVCFSPSAVVVIVFATVVVVVVFVVVVV